MTQTQILFRVKLQGFFTRDGFTFSNNVKPMTLTKFSDGTFMLKAGRKTLQHRFSSNTKLLKHAFESIGINL